MPVNICLRCEKLMAIPTSREFPFLEMWPKEMSTSLALVATMYIVIVQHRL